MASPGLLLYGADIINSALRSIGAIAPGETATRAEMQDALFTLNQMMDSWQAQRLLIFTISIQDFPLIAGQQVYTLGPGGNFNTARPPRIQSMSVLSLNNPAQPLELPLEYLTDQQWQAIPVKNIQSSLPQKVYDDGAFPLRSLSFWCIPNVQVNTRIYSWSALSTFADLDVTLYQFPPAYLRAIRYNLAVELAAEFPGDPALLPQVYQMAETSKAEIKSANAPLLDIYCDRSLVDPGKQLYNWLTDMPAGRGY